MQQQNGTLRQWQSVQQIHKFRFLFAADEQIVWSFTEFIQRFGDFIEQKFFATAFAPKLDNFLIRDTKEPASKFFIVAQATEMFDSGDKYLLHDVEARLFIARKFKNINVKWQLV